MQYGIAVGESDRHPIIGEMIILMTPTNGFVRVAVRETLKNLMVIAPMCGSREGMRFISENQKEPFFLYIATNAPHGPYRVDPKWAEPYQGNDVNNAIAGMIANIDHNLGLLRDHLEDLKLDKNTILIFMTDNGTSAGCKFPGLDTEPTLGFNAGMRGKKSSIYEGGISSFLSALAGWWSL